MLGAVMRLVVGGDGIGVTARGTVRVSKLWNPLETTADGRLSCMRAFSLAKEI